MQNGERSVRVYYKAAYRYPWNMSPPPQWNVSGWNRDHGGQPYVVNMARAARQNTNFRTALWTGEHFQVTLMSIPVGEDIGLEVHPATDQFIRIEAGQGRVQMGNRPDRLEFERPANTGSAVMVPAGTWHNIINTGNTPLKLSVIYAPPEHPYGTVHPTRASAEGRW